MLHDSGIATTLTPWIKRNATLEFITELIQMEYGIVLLPSQLRQTIADLKFTGALEAADVEGLPGAVVRPAAPTGIGVGTGNVWITPPGEVYNIRFYVNGTHKLTMNDYYITSLESIGAVAGDVVQVAIVSIVEVPGGPVGTVGWWARIAVP
jgi:hypothetical protein